MRFADPCHPLRCFRWSLLCGNIFRRVAIDPSECSLVPCDCLLLSPILEGRAIGSPCPRHGDRPSFGGPFPSPPLLYFLPLVSVASPLFLPPSFVAPRPYQAPSRDPTLRPRGAAGPFLPPISDPPGPGRHPPPSLPSFPRALLYLFVLPLPLRSSTKVLSCDGGFVLFGASMMCHCRLHPFFFRLNRHPC
jgi:hypothetical protein